MERRDIYRVTEKFNKAQWREFSRVKLGLDENKMAELEDRWGTDFLERKFKSVMAWQDQNDSSGNLLQALITLKHKFFCGEQEGANQSIAENPGRIVQPAADTDNLQARGYERCLDFESYKVTAKKGLVLIISNSFTGTSFDEQHHRTPACHKDVELMEELWRDTIGCTLLEGRSHRDKSAAEMRDLLRKLGSSRGYDYVVVVISTHGGMRKVSEEGQTESYQEVLWGNDDNPIKVDEIQKLFDNNAAQNLQDIPKLFILQYCRGEEINRGVLRGSNVTPDAVPNLRPIDPLMPTTSDVVTAYPALANQKSFKDENGSWFIQSIFNVFMDYYRLRHVTDMLTKVNREMMNRRGVVDMNDCKSMSIYESSLTKDFYLVKPSIHGGLAKPVESKAEGKKRPRHH
uniref:caspase-2-like n=1 Tax=Styela clava TaxID=7725 RepID=UPI001939B7C5|nr:caspase-2-like [Styela clava]